VVEVLAEVEDQEHQELILPEEVEVVLNELELLVADLVVQES
jgi:hypothetical protein